MKPAAIALTITWFSLAAVPAADEADYYEIVEIPVPDGVVAEVSGIEVLPGDKIAVATRRGDIYTVAGAFADDPSGAEWTLFAQGLHEPLGLAYQDGWLYATQRPEVSRLRDEDGDGRADLFESVNSDWGINGDYHEYAFGSRPDADGNIWVVLCLTGSFDANSDFRGWCLRVTPDGQLIPTASGVRSPGGIGHNSLGDYFYTDNQGIWNGSSSLKHLKIGGFTGVPKANKFYGLTDAIGPRPNDPKDGGRLQEERRRIPELVPPACVIPHGKMGQSPAGIECDETGGRFGPFTGQLFIAEQTFSEVQRVFLEQVDGVYQGACFKFRRGFGSGNITVRFGPDGSLFTGGTDRGWGARGGRRFALERVRWTGKTPFEVIAMRARPDGFALEFTVPVDRASASDTSAYRMEAFTYIYQSKYGSPEVDKSSPAVTGATVSDDGRTVRLTIDGLVRGHVHQLHLDGVRSAGARMPLLHPTAYYTLNEIPAE
jgi:glucose/arabinose dehydrogenase